MPNRTTTSSDALHLPRSAPIEAYGKGGFAFADMSHRGSLLCLPSGIYGWEPKDPLPRLAGVLRDLGELDEEFVHDVRGDDSGVT